MFSMRWWWVGTALMLALSLAGCLPGPNPDRPDMFLLDNDMPKVVRVLLTVQNSTGSTVGTKSYDVGAGETIQREWSWGKGSFIVLAQSDTGNATQEIRLGIVPQYVQVTVATWGVSISLLHGD